MAKPCGLTQDDFCGFRLYETTYRGQNFQKSLLFAGGIRDFQHDVSLDISAESTHNDERKLIEGIGTAKESRKCL
jgi:hypothetical protein